MRQATADEQPGKGKQSRDRGRTMRMGGIKIEGRVNRAWRLAGGGERSRNKLVVVTGLVATLRFGPGT